MYLKKLVISSKEGIIRAIDFKMGVNLIVDNTDLSDAKTTGNGVGKTTVLKLIDFCFGAKGNIIYTDTENRKSEDLKVKKFLQDEEVLIQLFLADDLFDPNSRTVKIERNFLASKKSIRRINGENILEKDYDKALWKSIFNIDAIEKPTFRQVVSHCIRYKNESIENTLKTLVPYTTDVEYETLYLYLLGCSTDSGERKQRLNTKLRQEIMFRETLESEHKKADCEIQLALINQEIGLLEEKKNSLGLSACDENDVEELNQVKREINKHSSTLSKLEIRKTLINEAKMELSSENAQLDLVQLRYLYREAKANIANLERTFEELLNYHNSMIVERMRFIVSDLPELDNQITKEKECLARLMEQEKSLSEKVARGDAFTELERVITELNNLYQNKGVYETLISQLAESEEQIQNITDELAEIDEDLFSNSFKEKLQNRLVSFNSFFCEISKELYDEQYLLSYVEQKDKNGTKVYKFTSTKPNMGSGKKQGESLCFDMAYLLFANSKGIPCLNFILNDKKELMSDNQLIKTAMYVMNMPMQIVVSMLKDKIPDRVLPYSNIILELSQDDKLFRIENT